MTTIELLRHAHAGSRRGWDGGPDGRRPLSERGRSQARELTTALLAREVDAVYSSPLLRCVQTCEPIAAAAGLRPALDERIGEARGIPVADDGDAWVASAWLGGRALALVDEVLERHAGGRVVLCSHGDVIPALLAVLAGRDGLELPDVRLPKAAFATLTFEGRRCVSARRGTVPAPPAT